MPVKDRLFYHDALLTFKCTNGMAPTNLCSRFIKRGMISGRSIDSQHKINWTYRAIKLLRDSEAFYTAQ